MPSYRQRAVVLRKTRLGETDLILTLLADDGRQVRAVAKGLRKPGSRFGGRLEPYSVVDLLLHTGKSLEVVTEARTVTSNTVLREDLDRSAAAAVVADLLDKISVQAQSEPRLFGLATTTLDVMGRSELIRLPALVIAFLIKALAMHGYRPELALCAQCACEAEDSIFFSVASGGVLCTHCGELDPSALRFPVQARQWLSVLLSSTMEQVAAEDMPAAAVIDCFTMMRAFTRYHLPARLKALDFYAGMLATS